MDTADKVNWCEETLPHATKKALQYLSGCEWIRSSSWYLAGGTALALQAGHRTSVDLDFFTKEKEFPHASITAYMPEEDWISDIERPGTLYGRLHGAQISFIAYPFFIPKEPMLHYGTVSVLSARDIAVMKIVAISQRGRKRDFIDLYWYATNKEPLEDVIKRLPEQYPTVAHDYQHIMKALIYFADAEEDPMPVLNFDADWETVKAYFRREVPAITKRLLKLS